MNQPDGQWDGRLRHETKNKHEQLKVLSRSQLEDSFCCRVVDNDEETTASDDDGNYGEE